MLHLSLPYEPTFIKSGASVAFGVLASTARTGREVAPLDHDWRKCSTMGENWKMDALNPVKQYFRKTTGLSRIVNAEVRYIGHTHKSKRYFRGAFLDEILCIVTSCTKKLLGFRIFVYYVNIVDVIP